MGHEVSLELCASLRLVLIPPITAGTTAEVRDGFLTGRDTRWRWSNAFPSGNKRAAVAGIDHAPVQRDPPQVHCRETRFRDSCCQVPGKRSKAHCKACCVPRTVCLAPRTRRNGLGTICNGSSPICNALWITCNDLWIDCNGSWIDCPRVSPCCIETLRPFQSVSYLVSLLKTP